MKKILLIMLMMILISSCNQTKKLEVEDIYIPLKTERQIAIEKLNETLNQIGLTDCLDENGNIKDYCKDILYNDGDGLVYD